MQAPLKRITGKPFFFLLVVTITFAFVLSIANCQAQPNNGPGPVLVTPNAAAIFRSQERPIGTYTGTAPVNIPICTVNSGPLSLPVSLDYNMGGIKVDEVASSVGLGFSLSEGGLISRVINDVADELSTGYLYETIKPSHFNYTNPLQVYEYTTNSFDLEPDIFMYSFNGGSGKFFFNEQGDVVLMNKSPIKITPIIAPNQPLKGWIIVDEKGNKYYFGTSKDQSVSNVDLSVSLTQSLLNPQGPISPSGGVTSWHLTEVYDMNEENKITLTYGKTVETMFRTLSGGYSRLGGYLSAPLLGSCDMPDLQLDEMVSRNYHDESYLTRIDAGNGYVLFNNSTDRQDYFGGVKVNYIALYAPDGTLKSQYDFNYSYTVSNDTPDPGHPDESKRLRLENFAQLNSSGTDRLTYRFVYDDAVTLPKRLSFAIDYWGYYNGRDNNPHLVPNIHVLLPRDNNTMARVDEFSDRSARPQFSKAGSLIKITYPTGGYRQFTYEGNQALVEVNDHMQPDPNYTTYQTATANFPNNSTLPFWPDVQQYFTINSAEGSAVLNYSIDELVDPYDGFTVYIESISAPSPYPYPLAGTLIQSFTTLTGHIELPNGTYRMEVMKDAGIFNTLTLNWSESTLKASTITRYGPKAMNNRNVGGLRLQQVDDYDPVTNKTNTTQYTYKLYQDDPTLTSGLLISPLRLVNAGAISGATCDFYKLTAGSTYPLASQGGSYVFYPEVRTTEPGNGYTDRIFNFIPDGLGENILDMDQLPVVPPQDNSTLRGQLLSETVYDNNGVKLKNTSYSYTAVPDALQDAVLARKVKPYYTHIEPTANPIENYYICNRNFPERDGDLPCTSFSNTYYVAAFSILLIGKGEIWYTPAGSLSSITNFTYYKGAGQFVVNTATTTLSNGNVVGLTNRYAFNNTSDFTFGLSASDLTAKTALLGANYLQPLEIVTTVTPPGGSATITGGKKFGFNYFNGSKLHLAALYHYKSGDLSNPEKTVFSAYDNYGNLAEVSQNGGSNTVYLWGYKGNYPVAKIAGSNYLTVSGQVNQSILDNPSSDATLSSHLGQLRTSLPGATLTNIYTYSPLTGMTSSTDARGVPTYYIYDNFQRLMNVRDKDNNIIKTIDYHYKSQ